jgi:hypothetical protein
MTNKTKLSIVDNVLMFTGVFLLVFGFSVWDSVLACGAGGLLLYMAGTCLGKSLSL